MPISQTRIRARRAGSTSAATFARIAREIPLYAYLVADVDFARGRIVPDRLGQKEHAHYLTLAARMLNLTPARTNPDFSHSLGL